MSGQNQPDQMLSVSLRDYFEAKFMANKVELDLARTLMEKRLDAMNEFRETLRDQSLKFITRGEIELLVGPIAADIRDLRESRATIAGKASQNSVLIAYIASGISIVIAVVGVLSK